MTEKSNEEKSKEILEKDKKVNEGNKEKHKSNSQKKEDNQEEETKLCDECQKPINGIIKHPYKKGKELDTCKACYDKILNQGACKACGRIKEFCECKTNIPEDNPREEYDIEIRKRGMEIVENGELMEYYLKTTSKYHFGDIKVKMHCITAHVSKFIPGEKLRHLGFTGGSGGGKTSCAMKSLLALPLHQWVYFGNISEKALYYYCEDNPKRLQYKTVYIDEVDPDMYSTLKSLTIQDGFDAPALTVVNGKAVELNPEKPFNVMASSVMAFKEEEVQNRFEFPESDDSKEAKENTDYQIMISKSQNGLWTMGKLKNDDIDYKICRAAVEYLTESKKINGCIIPKELLDAEILQFTFNFSRGDKISFMGLCNTTAYINICKRKITEKNEIIVEKDDIETAKVIWGSTSTKLSAIERYIMEIFGREDEIIGNMLESFKVLSQEDIIKYVQKYYMKTPASSTVYKSIQSLLHKGLLAKSGGNGQKIQYTLSENKDIFERKSNGGISIIDGIKGLIEYNKWLFPSMIKGIIDVKETEQMIKMLISNNKIVGNKSPDEIQNSICEYCTSIQAQNKN